MKIEKAAGALGAVVRADLARLLDDPKGFAGLQAALDEHGVLVLPDQDVPTSTLARFAKRFGDVLPHGAYPTVVDAPDVQVLESTPERPSKIEAWHSDMTFALEPPSVTMLHADVVPAAGGDTLWASSAAAYETLSPPMRRLVDGLHAEHDFRFGFRESLEEPGGPQRLAATIAANPPVRHPVVRTHPRTGRKSLYVNALFTTRVVGLRAAESEALLRFLYEHITADEHTYRLRWARHTIALWDNRITQHKPVNDFHPQHRRLHRVTVSGERPV